MLIDPNNQCQSFFVLKEIVSPFLQYFSWIFFNSNLDCADFGLFNLGTRGNWNPSEFKCQNLEYAGAKLHYVSRCLQSQDCFTTLLVLLLRCDVKCANTACWAILNFTNVSILSPTFWLLGCYLFHLSMRFALDLIQTRNQCLPMEGVYGNSIT